MRRKQIKMWPTYTLLGIFLVPIGIGIYTYVTADFSLQPTPKQVVAVEPVLPVPDLPLHQAAMVLRQTATPASVDANDTLFPNTKSMMIGEVAVEASIAKTWPERIQGLSNTPYLPPTTVKFFVFDSIGFHSIWMKDMQYAIDIIWVDEKNTIVDIVQNATPESYPDVLYTPQSRALYVIETVAGFVATNQISIGDQITPPELR